MVPIDFDEIPAGATRTVYAEDQPIYIPLPALRLPTGEVCSRWKLSPAEIEQISKTGEIFLVMLTGNEDLQPVMLGVTQPVVGDLNDSLCFLFPDIDGTDQTNQARNDSTAGTAISDASGTEPATAASAPETN